MLPFFATFFVLGVSFSIYFLFISTKAHGVLGFWGGVGPERDDCVIR
jgi:hypothetical protein